MDWWAKHSSRSNPERILQSKTGVLPRPIIALTSQVGEVAVVRTPVSYKCGWGSNKTNPHPNLPGVNILVWYVILQAGCIYPWKECACVIQLAHFPRSFGEREQPLLSRKAKFTDAGEGLNIIRTITHPNLPSIREGAHVVVQSLLSPRLLNSTSLRGNSHSARSNPERILQLKTGWVKPNNNNMDCRVALAPRKDAQPVVLPTSQNTFTPDAQFARSPRPIGEREQLFLSRQAKVTDAGEGLKVFKTIPHPTPLKKFIIKIFK